VHDEELAGADWIIDGAQRAQTELANLAERGLVGAPARAREEDALQPRAAVARDLQLAGR
jgi:hypothetical protein